MLKLSGDAGKLYSKMKSYFTSRCPFDEVKEEIEKYRPVNIANTILERQRKVRKLIEISKRVDFEKVKKLETVRVKKRFFSDRVFVAKSNEEYERALSLGVCDVVRDDCESRYSIILNDFVSEISIKAFSPETVISALLENLESFRALAELEKDVFGDHVYMKILEELKSLEGYYRRLEEISRIEERAREIEAEINLEIERRLSDIKLTITADKLLKLIERGEIANEIREHVSSVVEGYEREFEDIGILEPVFTRTFPVRLDRDTLERAVESVRDSISLEFYLRCLKLAEKIGVEEINSRISFYRSLSLYRVFADEDFFFPELSDGTEFRGGRNFFIPDAIPVSYCIGRSQLFEHEVNVAVLTGANSGGKTSLLELVCQIVILAHMGFPVNAEVAKVSVYDEIFYFRRKQSSYGSGAFEKAIMSIAKAVSGEGRKLILIDEFESVTEPGAGAKILASLFRIADSKGHHVIAVSHLGDEFREFDFLRIDGIEARGLDENLNLIVDRQPVFGKIGKSTPELIIERLMERNRGEMKKIFAEILEMFKGEENV